MPAIKHECAVGYKFIILCLKGVKYCMKVYRTSKLRVHRVQWPALVRLAALKWPCRAVGTFVVLDSKMASPAAHVDNYFDYLWVHRTPLPMGLHCQGPLVMGARSPGGPWAPFTGAVPSVLPDDPLHTAEATNLMVPWKKRGKSKCACLLPVDSRLKTHDSLPIPQ